MPSSHNSNTKHCQCCSTILHDISVNSMRLCSSFAEVLPSLCESRRAGMGTLMIRIGHLLPCSKTRKMMHEYLANNLTRLALQALSGTNQTLFLTSVESMWLFTLQGSVWQSIASLCSMKTLFLPNAVLSTPLHL